MTKLRYREFADSTGFPFIAHGHRRHDPCPQQQGLALHVFLHPPESEVSKRLLAAVKQMGGLLLMMSRVLFLAAGDPMCNVAIVDAIAVGLCIPAVTPIISLYTTDVRSPYPGYLIWTRSLG